MRGTTTPKDKYLKLLMKLDLKKTSLRSAGLIKCGASRSCKIRYFCVFVWNLYVRKLGNFEILKTGLIDIGNDTGKKYP